ncbi:molybdenum cofactor biosynthesis protein MoaE [Actinoalloteichus spitiensis]|uniref:molybdenum cofactor biosynthesis protein MoaE n=1 Tax=Actinoalloteichus spitiensis TaxID=252394 RepID=UPI00037DE3B9|nr:molybdenum cofactor biosynthesis protein MoaE [Actinoalloteichus spitiensis]
MDTANRPELTADPGEARVITASTRAAAGVYPDRTGPLVVDWLRQRGFRVPDAAVVPDGAPVAEELRRALDDRVSVVLTTGGTGISPTDRTPDVTRPLLDRELPGLSDAIRRAGLPAVPTAVLSRAVAGTAGATLVVNLPGSTGGVRDGLAVLDGVFAHALDQITGGDHAAAVPSEPSGGAADGPAEVAATTSTTSPGARGTARPAPAPEVEVPLVSVTTAPLNLADHASAVSRRQAGAVVTFSGEVRDHDHGRAVRDLEYVAHPSAEQVLREVAEDVARRLPGLRALAVSHRAGWLAIGECALACAVAADHRAEAFAACAELVDEVKRRLPVWKRQRFADGGEEWVNCP